MLKTILCVLVLTNTLAQSEYANYHDVLGIGFYAPHVNLMSTQMITGHQSIINVDDSKLYKVCDDLVLQDQYFENSADFVSSISGETSVDVGFREEFTLGTTLKSVFGVSDVSRYEAQVYRLSEFDCVEIAGIDIDKAQVKTSLLDAINELPQICGSSVSHGQLNEYGEFLTKYGSHVVVSAVQGVRMAQWVAAETSMEYSSDDLKLNACVNMEGLSSKNQFVKGCSQFNESERESVKTEGVKSYFMIRGGDPQLRAQLSEDRSAEIVEKFMSSANEASNSAIIVQSRPIWELIADSVDLYADGGVTRTKLMTLKAYFEGYLDFQCPIEEPLQFFKTKEYDPSSGYITFKCERMNDGCHQDTDCHDLGAGFPPCYCYGETCVDGFDSTMRKPKTRSSWKSSWPDDIDNSCFWEFGCYCSTMESRSTIVWESDENLSSSSNHWDRLLGYFQEQ